MPWHLIIPAYILWCLYWFRWVLGDIVYSDKEPIDSEALWIAIGFGLVLWPVAVCFAIGGTLKHLNINPADRTIWTRLLLAKPLHVRLKDREEAAKVKLAEIKKMEAEIEAHDDIQKALDSAKEVS